LAAAKWVTDEGVGRAFVPFQKQRLQVDLNARNGEFVSKANASGVSVNSAKMRSHAPIPRRDDQLERRNCALEKRFASLDGKGLQ
jgi:hypothetical protein